jgi:ubiquinone/menaquinone biosynthesis C-methylase UbiE
MAASIDISVREGYERWAPSYPHVPGNPLMRAEQQLMLRNWPEVAGRRALDLACGSGRYARLLREGAAAQIVALDASPGMLRRVAGAGRVCGSLSRLPFTAGSFDVVVCGLAVGHEPDIATWMSEVARVLAPGGTFLYSDFHPQAARAGLARSFTDEQQQSYTLPHFVHDLSAQRVAAESAGLAISVAQEVRVGMELTEAFAQSESFYQRWHGLPLVQVVRVEKP